MHHNNYLASKEFKFVESYLRLQSHLSTRHHKCKYRVRWCSSLVAFESTVVDFFRTQCQIGHEQNILVILSSFRLQF